MDTKTFNENYELERNAKGVRARAKNPADEPVEVMTADGTVYDPATTYHFFDSQTQQIRQSLGLRRDGEYLCTFGLRVVAVSRLRERRDDALADGQKFFTQEIGLLHKRIGDYELEKTGERRNLKSFPMTKF